MNKMQTIYYLFPINVIFFLMTYFMFNADIFLFMKV